MLRSLNIKNYALIEQLEVVFDPGLTVITGETGAGKSILAGSLSLVLGKRADASMINYPDKKCIIEAQFDFTNSSMQPFFESLLLDFDHDTFIRREILPSGKSRAFVNDTPVTLDVLKKLGGRLIDIHSQHQNLRLKENTFQYQLLDSVAKSSKLLHTWKTTKNIWQKAKKELEELQVYKEESLKEADYNSFLLEELEGTPMAPDLLEELEETQKKLAHTEEINERLSNALVQLNNDQVGVVPLLSETKIQLSKITDLSEKYKVLNQRLEAVVIETNDITAEIGASLEEIESRPDNLEEINSQLQQLYTLLKKHKAGNLQELIAIREALTAKQDRTTNLDVEIEKLKLEVGLKQKELDFLGLELLKRRKKVAPQIVKSLQLTLSDLGMPHARFTVELEACNEYKSNGKDELIFLFSANKGRETVELKKAVSGGETSRIMLAIKSLLAKHTQLPTVFFDEIDTGISGEIGSKMGEIMKSMSAEMQVISITHLPQIASKGHAHYKVYKQVEQGHTVSQIKKLNNAGRIKEIALMLGGEKDSDLATAHARELLTY